MKKILIGLALALLLASCGQKEPQTVYHLTMEYTQHDTGDINCIEHTYDDQWRPRKVTVLLNREESSHVEYQYSQDGRIANEYSKTTGLSSSELRWKFDEAGNIIQADLYDMELLHSTVYTYDRQGRELTSRTTAPDGSVLMEIENTYDAGGNLLTRVTRTGPQETREEYTYDRKDRIAGYKRYQGENLTMVFTYTWEDNTSTCTQMDGEETVTGFTLSTYDDWGNLLYQESQDRGGAVTRCSWYAYAGEDGSTAGKIPK